MGHLANASPISALKCAVVCIVLVHAHDDMVPLPHDDIVPETTHETHAQALKLIASLRNQLKTSEQRRQRDVDNLKQMISHRDAVITQLKKRQGGKEGKKPKKGKAEVLSKGATPKGEERFVQQKFTPIYTSLIGVANFLPIPSGPWARMSRSGERDVKAQAVLIEQTGTRWRRRKSVASSGGRATADLLPWKIEYPKSGAINDSTSECKKWWNSQNGPATRGRKAVALTYKDRFDKHSKKWYLNHEAGRSNKGKWVLATKTGCTVIRRAGGSHGNDVVRVCGCYEIWCPYPLTQHHRKRQCNTIRNIFGCFKNDEWLPDCRVGQMPLPEVIVL